MSRFLCAALFALPAFAVGTPYDPPRITIEKAIKEAEQCVKARKINLKSSYLASAKFENRVLDEDGARRKGRYWGVVWLQWPPVPEGSIEVRIYETKECLMSEGNAPFK